MYKLNLTVASSILSKVPIHERDQITSMIKQHRIVVNRDIMDYYKLTNPEFFRWLSSYISGVGNNKAYDAVEYRNVDIQTKSIQEQIIKCVMRDKQEDLILLSEKNEFEEYDIQNIKMFDWQSIKDGSHDYILKYSLPYRYELTYNQPTVEFKKWFKNICKGESKVIFEDPYFFARSLDGLNAFYYEWYPLLEEDTQIIVCCRTDSAEFLSAEEIRQEIKKHRYRNWKIEIYDTSNMHDRHIWCDSWWIDLGYGLSVLGQEQKVRQNTSANFVPKPKNRDTSRIEGTKIYPRF